MKAFRFRLEKVMEWRHLQMRAEEEKLAVLQHRLGQLKYRINALTSAELKSEWGLLKQPSVWGSELEAFTSFQARVKFERAAIERDQSQCEKWIVAQRTKLLKARLDFRVLEKLKEKRKEEWTYLSDRELENAAADAHNSRLFRGEL